jgi:NTP pyrophosphatase (non-canonical NTP hydrolase)
MSLVPYYIGFTCLGTIIGFGLALLIGYRYGLKRKRGATKVQSAQADLQAEMEKFFTGFNNKERNILGDLRRLNPERCKAFGHAVTDMPITFWTTAVAGEAGELCNWVKKMERGDNIPAIKHEIAMEAADIVIYLDMLCFHQSIDLQGAIIKKFNEVSDRANSPIKL